MKLFDLYTEHEAWAKTTILNEAPNHKRLSFAKESEDPSWILMQGRLENLREQYKTFMNNVGNTNTTPEYIKSFHNKLSNAFTNKKDSTAETKQPAGAGAWNTKYNPDLFIAKYHELSSALEARMEQHTKNNTNASTEGVETQKEFFSLQAATLKFFLSVPQFKISRFEEWFGSLRNALQDMEPSIKAEFDQLTKNGNRDGSGLDEVRNAHREIGLKSAVQKGWLEETDDSYKVLIPFRIGATVVSDQRFKQSQATQLSGLKTVLDAAAATAEKWKPSTAVPNTDGSKLKSGLADEGSAQTRVGGGNIAQQKAARKAKVEKIRQEAQGMRSASANVNQHRVEIKKMAEEKYGIKLNKKEEEFIHA